MGLTSLDQRVLQAVRAGQIRQRRAVNGSAAGPYADYYTHRDKIDGRPLTHAEQRSLRQLCLNLDVLPPRLPNGPGSGLYTTCAIVET